MKKASFIFALTFILQPLTYADTASDAVNAVVTRMADGEFGSWVGSGKLIYQSVKLNTGRLGWYIYRDTSGHSVLLSGRLDGINYLLQEETVQGTPEKFLAEQLAGLLTSTMAPAGSFVITKKFADNFSRNGSTNAMLQHYSLEPSPRVAGNEWILDVNIGSNLGSIEHWHLAGQLLPIQISTFDRTVLEGNKSFGPILVTAGVGNNGSQ